MSERYVISASNGRTLTVVKVKCGDFVVVVRIAESIPVT
jgi:hypothetical protein